MQTLNLINTLTSQDILMIKASRMYRMPENNQEVKRFWAALEVFFFSVCKSPTQSLTFHRTEISWRFLTTFRFVSFHFILFCASWVLSCEFTLSKGKNVEETLCLQPRQFVSISLHLRLYANYCSSAGFRWRQKCRFWIPRWLPFWAPFLFWLSRFYKLSFRLFIPTF